MPAALVLLTVASDENQHPRLVALLAPLLGQHMAAKALELLCSKTGRPVGTVLAEDLPDAAEVLGPMLRTLIGRESAAAVLSEIQGGTLK